MTKKVGRADKITLPHAGHAKKKDERSKIDWAHAKPIVLVAVDQFDAGHYTMDDMGQVDTSDGDKHDERELMQAVKTLKPNQRLLWFVRGEVDTTKQGAPIEAAPEHPAAA